MNPFKLERLPPNLQLQRWINRCLASRLLKALPQRLGTLLGALPGLSSTGTFRYDGKQSIRFNGRNHQFHALYEDYYQQGYELETLLLIRLLLRGDGTFVDAGANWGCFALAAAALPDYSGRIVCYEPHPATFADLESCVAQACLGSRILARNVGLGVTPGDLHLAPDASGHSGMTRLTPHGCGQLVTVTSLDAETQDNVTLIKVDVEGMELEVLQGAQQTLARCKPAVIVENFLHHAQPALTLDPIRWLQAYDYAVFAPAALVQRGSETIPLPYASPPPQPGDVLEIHRMAFMPVTTANRFLLPAQLNLLALPREKLATLPGHILN